MPNAFRRHRQSRWIFEVNLIDAHQVHIFVGEQILGKHLARGGRAAGRRLGGVAAVIGSLCLLGCSGGISSLVGSLFLAVFLGFFDRQLQLHAGVDFTQHLARFFNIAVAQERLQLSDGKVKPILVSKPTGKAESSSMFFGRDGCFDARVPRLKLQLQHDPVDLLARNTAAHTVYLELNFFKRVLEDFTTHDGAITQLHQAALAGLWMDQFNDVKHLRFIEGARLKSVRDGDNEVGLAHHRSTEFFPAIDEDPDLVNRLGLGAGRWWANKFFTGYG